MILSKRVVLILYYLYPALIWAEVSDFEWNMSKSEIEKNHSLMEFKIEILEKNIRVFCGKKESKNIKFYILDDFQKQRVCDLDFFRFLGFYKDSLFAICYSTEELPPDYELKTEKCVQDYFYEPNCPTLNVYAIIKNQKGGGGNIFGEASLMIRSDCDEHYVVELESRGTSFFSPQHKQYTFLTFYRKIADRIRDKLKVHPENRKLIHPIDIFSTSMHDSYKEFQKPLGNHE